MTSKLQKKPSALKREHPALQNMKFSVADPDPESGAFMTPGSGIRNRFFPDLGSRISNPYF
jgi:hypothetical protein